jgi:hypothetical protein
VRTAAGGLAEKSAGGVKGVVVRAAADDGAAATTRHFRHVAYLDGKPRPLLRGWLHALLTVATAAWLLHMYLVPAQPAVLGTRRQQLGFLWGKGVVHLASAAYHVVDFRSPSLLRVANMLDLALIPAAIFALISLSTDASRLLDLGGGGLGGGDNHAGTAAALDGPLSFFGEAPLAEEDEAGRWWHAELTLLATVLALNAVAVLWQFRGAVPGSGDPRSIILMAYYAYSEFIGYEAVHGDRTAAFSSLACESGGDRLEPPSWLGNPSALWRCALPAYVVAFGFGKVVDDFRMTEPVSRWLPHHAEGLWSLHEDFHVLLTVADLFGMASGAANHFARGAC